MAGARSVIEERYSEQVVINVRIQREIECMSRWSWKKLRISAVTSNANETQVQMPSTRDTIWPCLDSCEANVIKYLVVL